MFLEEEKAYFEVDKDGRLILKKKKIDLNNITDEELKALGIDPTLSAVEIAKKLKVKLIVNAKKNKRNTNMIKY